jgi:hypothetical protein
VATHSAAIVAAVRLCVATATSVHWCVTATGCTAITASATHHTIQQFESVAVATECHAANQRGDNHFEFHRDLSPRLYWSLFESIQRRLVIGRAIKRLERSVEWSASVTNPVIQAGPLILSRG